MSPDRDDPSKSETADGQPDGDPTVLSPETVRQYLEAGNQTTDDDTKSLLETAEKAPSRLLGVEPMATLRQTFFEGASAERERATAILAALSAEAPRRTQAVWTLARWRQNDRTSWEPADTDSAPLPDVVEPDDPEEPLLTRREVLMETAALARERHTAVIDALQTISGCLYDDSWLVEVHAFRTLKRFHEASVYTLPGDDAGYLENYATGSRLQVLLNHEEPWVRTDAAEAVARMAGSSHNRVEDLAPYIPDLEDCLTDSLGRTRVAAAEALARITTPITETLSTWPTEHLTQEPEVSLTSEDRPDTAALRSALDDDRTDVREQAAWALVQTAEPDELAPAVEAAQEMLDADETSLHEPGAWLLAKAAIEHPQRVSTAVDTLAAAFPDADSQIRPAVATALVLVGRECPDAVDLERLYAVDGENVPKTVGHELLCDAVGTDDHRAIVEQLRPLLDSNDERIVRGVLTTLKHLARNDPTTTLPATPDIRAVRTENPEITSETVAPLAHIGIISPDRVDLDELLNVDDPDDRLTAIRAFNTAAHRRPEDTAAVIGTVEPLLDDSEKRIRQKAVESLRWVAEKRPEAVAPLIKPLRPRLTDGTNLRRKTARVMAQVAKSEPGAVAPLTDTLRALGDDGDRTVRAKAGEALEQVVDTDHREEWWSFPLLEYRQRVRNRTETLLDGGEADYWESFRYFDGVAEFELREGARILLTLRLDAGRDTAPYQIWQGNPADYDDGSHSGLLAEYNTIEEALKDWTTHLDA